jgi:hypothetical protein
MNRVIPCVLMRAGTSRGPFFLREWLPSDDAERDEALIGAIGASDLLQVDGVGGGSTLTSKVAIISKSLQPGCDIDGRVRAAGEHDPGVVVVALATILKVELVEDRPESIRDHNQPCWRQ